MINVSCLVCGDKILVVAGWSEVVNDWWWLVVQL